MRISLSRYHFPPCLQKQSTILLLNIIVAQGCYFIYDKLHSMDTDSTHCSRIRSRHVDSNKESTVALRSSSTCTASQLTRYPLYRNNYGISSRIAHPFPFQNWSNHPMYSSKYHRILQIQKFNGNPMNRRQRARQNRLNERK